ncbi:EpsG family protein [Butyricicoccus sp.]|uniref:EpsG family protein n=1 Tax=Butyricicoccus sp. TaxID=2049021 RepID=UPI003F1649FA
MNTVIQLGFYLVLMAVVAASAWAAQKLDKKILLIIPIVALTLVAGLRAETVGVDTKSNIQAFISCYYRGFTFVTKEHLYYLIAAGLLHLWGNTSVVLTVYAGVIYTLVFLRLWDFRRMVNLGIASALFFMFYFGGTMNGMRQYIAVAIVFFATRYLQQEKEFLFLAAMMLAFCFHRSSIIAALFFFFYIGIKRVYGVKQFFILFFSAGVAVPLSIYFLRQYSGYLSGASDVDFGLMGSIQLFMLVFTYFFCRSGMDVPALTDGEADTVSFRLMFMITLLGMILAMASFVVDYASRMGYYFRFFEIVYYSMIFQSKWIGRNVKFLLGAALFLLGVYHLYAYHGIIPYHTIFG